MKKILLLIVLGLVVFIVIHRQRIFLWDPIASVTRTGIKQGSVRVMINYSNDVLIDDASTNKRRIYLVQNWNRLPEYPTGQLKCIEYLACMTDADKASGVSILPGSRGRRDSVEGVAMTNKQVEFIDENGMLVQVTLR